MSDDFSTLMAAADPPLVVVTTVAEGERAGCLVGFHSQSSISPGRYCLWLSKANHTFRVALLASHFAVHFLTDGDLAVAEHFGTVSGEDTDKFAGVELVGGRTGVRSGAALRAEATGEAAGTERTGGIGGVGVPLLVACPNRMLLERIAVLDDGGDHVCLTARVLKVESTGDFTPLRVSAAAHLEPGHAAEERALEP